MFERFSRSWALVKASATVLQQDRQLLIFPLMCALSMMLVLAGFALPLFGLDAFDALQASESGLHRLYSIGFLFYVLQYAIVFYFNTALVGAVMLRLDGGTPTLGAGLRVANGRFGAILGYAIVAATVGVVLRIVQERVGALGKFVVGLLGVGWSAATFMVVPVLVATGVGPLQAIKESAGLLKRGWGENVIGQGGLSLAFSLLYALLAVGGAALVVAAFLTQSLFLFVLACVGAVMVLLTTVLIHAALAGVYSATLYRYAAGGAFGAGFEPRALQGAFGPKR